MNHIHLPRSLIILLFILVAITFFVGTLHAFTLAHAISNATITPATPIVLNIPSTTPAESESETPLFTPTVMNTGQADSDENFTPTPTPIPEQTSADTTGIIALAILMVVVMLVGVAWGGRRPGKKEEPKK